MDHTWRSTPSGLQACLEKRAQRNQAEESEQHRHPSLAGSKKILRRVLGHGKKKTLGPVVQFKLEFLEKGIFFFFSSAKKICVHQL